MRICMVMLFTENAYCAQPAKTPNYSLLPHHLTPATSPISTVLSSIDKIYFPFFPLVPLLLLKQRPFLSPHQLIPTTPHKR